MFLIIKILINVDRINFFEKSEKFLIFIFKVKVLTYKKITIIPPKKIKIIAKAIHFENNWKHNILTVPANKTNIKDIINGFAVDKILIIIVIEIKIKNIKLI